MLVCASFAHKESRYGFVLIGIVVIAERRGNRDGLALEIIREETGKKGHNWNGGSGWS